MRRSNMALEFDREKHTKTVSTAGHQKIVYSDSARQLSFMLCRPMRIASMLGVSYPLPEKQCGADVQDPRILEGDCELLRR